MFVTALLLGLVGVFCILDSRILGRMNFERPLITCTIVGALLGDLQTGLTLGASIELMSLGKAVLTGEEESSGRYIVMSRVLETEGRYEKFVLSPETDASADAGRPFILSGAILFGSKDHQAAVQKMIGKPVSLDEIDALLGAW